MATSHRATFAPAEAPWVRPQPEQRAGIAEIDCVRAFGVDYVRVLEEDGGELYVTRFGSALLDHVRPASWFRQRQYARRGRRLPGSTGTVHRVPTQDRHGRRGDLVVKFNRFAQNVPLVITRSAAAHVRPAEVMGARFNSPFEEFGLLRELRCARFGPADLRIRTKRPLAIHCPPQQYPLWQLGRSKSAYAGYRGVHERDQAASSTRHVELHLEREYVTLFHWVDGDDAEALTVQGALDEAELEALTQRVDRELRAKGFRVLDHKPKHLILRRRHRTGEPLRRQGKLVYALIDFELLQRTEAYEAWRAAHPEMSV